MKKIILLLLLFPGLLFGEYFYVGSSTEGLIVVSKINNTLTIKKIIPLYGEIKSIRRVNNKLFIAAGLGGVYIYDISNPADPVKFSEYDTKGFALDTAVYGDTLYVSDFEDGIKVFKITRGTLTRIMKLKTLDMAMTIKLSFPFLFVANSNNGLLIYDIRNPEDPKFIRSIDTPGIVWDVDFDGRYLYVALKENGFAIYDFSKPPLANLISQTKPGGVIFKVRKWKNYLIALQSEQDIHGGEIKNKGILIYDVSHPETPQKVSQFSSMFVEDFTVQNNKLYLAMVKNGLGILDITNIKKPKLTNILNIGYSAKDVWCNDKTAVVADGKGGAKFIDISNPAQARISYYLQTKGEVDQVCGIGDRVFIPDKEYGVYIYNVSNPYSPQLLYTIKKKGAISLRCKGNYLYVLYENYGIKIYQIDPKPYWVTELLSGGKQIYDIAVGKDRLYLSEGWDGVTLINIKNLTRPIPTGHMASLNEAEGIAARGKYFFLARIDAGMMIGDATDFYNMYELSHVNLSVNALAVKLFGNYAFLAGDSDGLFIINIKNLEKPYVFSKIKTPGNVKNSYLYGTHICIADGWNGFVLADFTNPEFPKIVADLLWFVPTAITH